MPSLTGWLLVYEQNGKEVWRVLPPETQTTSLTMPKNRVVPVLLYPLTAVAEGSSGQFRFFKPAGCIYPFSPYASWQDGFGAQLLLDILTSSSGDYENHRAFCARFNWRRFQDEIAALAAEDRTFNPWTINRAKLFASFALGKFSKTLLKGDVTAVTVTGGTSRYVQSYVPVPALEPDSAGTGEFVFAYCPSGENLLFDGAAVFRVYQPRNSSGAGGYRLALMNAGGYTLDP
jgi:hypothetical protein